MTVNKEITRQEHSTVKLTITVSMNDIRSEYDSILSNYSKTLQIPGFRKGKVPKSILNNKFGEPLKEEVQGEVIEKALGMVFEDESFPKENLPLPYSSPKIKDKPSFDLESDFSFSVIYDVFPVVSMGTWQGLEIEVPDVVVEDADIDRELEEIRERNSIVLDKDDGQTAEKEDVVTVDYAELNEAGEILPGTERQDFAFTLGVSHNFYKFDDEVTGMKKGETKDIVKVYPEDYENRDLAGQTKRIRITVTALKEKKLPDLDDDLAQDVDEKYNTLEDLKNSIRERFSGDLEKRLKVIKVNKLLEKIMETTPVEIPESMIQFELNSRWRNLTRNFDMDPEKLAEIMNSDDSYAKTIINAWKPDAVNALHSHVIMETLAKELKIEVSEEDLEKEMENIARISETSIEEVKEHYAKGNAGEYLKEDIKENKLFDELFSRNTVKSGEKKNYFELVIQNE